MPFWPGERLNLRFEGNAGTAELDFEGRLYTVDNGGLRVERDGGLICDPLVLPAMPGEFEYVFSDGEVEKRGTLRTIDPGASQRLPAAPAPDNGESPGIAG